MACKGNKKWNFANLNNCKNPEILRILALFSDLGNSTFKNPQRASKVAQLFSPYLYKSV
jgi:hypothetical protein